MPLDLFQPWEHLSSVKGGPQSSENIRSGAYKLVSLGITFFVASRSSNSPTVPATMDTELPPQSEYGSRRPNSGGVNSGFTGVGPGAGVPHGSAPSSNLGILADKVATQMQLNAKWRAQLHSFKQVSNPTQKCLLSLTAPLASFCRWLSTFRLRCRVSPCCSRLSCSSSVKTTIISVTMSQRSRVRSMAFKLI